MSSQQRDIDVYIFHTKQDVAMAFFREEKCLKQTKVSKKQLGESLIETFQNSLKSLNLGLSNVKGLYLNSSFSTWNASRLVTLFVKTLTTFEERLSLFSLKESQDKDDLDLAVKNFYSIKKHFKEVEDPEKEEVLYKIWSNINI